MTRTTPLWRRALLFVALASLIVGLTPAAGAQSAPAARYIVVLEDSVSGVGELASTLADQYAGRVGLTFRHALKGFTITLTQDEAAALENNPLVDYVEEDGVMSISTTQPNATWGLDRIDQRSLPLDTNFNFTNTGAGVDAYIIDTGIRLSHSDFGGRAITAFDAVDGGSADVCNGHGTHVSGTVGGSTYGVAKGVTLVGVRVLDCDGSGTTSGVIAGIDWVTSDHTSGPAIANMSLGGGASAALDDAVRRSITDGVSYAVAAGNGNFLGVEDDACFYSPARVGEAMTIGATDSNDAKASFSNYGNCVDWFAPGVGITSDWWTTDTATNTISGTSMATPHTAGVAALYLQGNPGASPSTVRTALFDLTTKGIVTSARTTNNHLLFNNM